MHKEKLIRVALNKDLADLVLRNTRTVNVFTGEILFADIAISEGYIASLGDAGTLMGKEIVDLQGAYTVPGFINSHCHVESSMVTPAVYSMEEVRHGVTTIITDPHEIVNVLGAKGVKLMLKASENCPINYYIQIPSCVPCTPFEHNGEDFTADKMAEFLDNPRVLGLGEVMDYVGVNNCDTELMKKLYLFEGKTIDGHAPNISGAGLQAYRAAGMNTDHESTSYTETLDKLRVGISALIREGSACKNTRDIIKGVVKDGIDTFNMAFCADDKHLSDIRIEGTIINNIKIAVSEGLSPIKAIQMATINPAKIYGLKDIGAISAGYKADIVVLKDLDSFEILKVYKSGVSYDKLEMPSFKAYEDVLKTVNLPKLTEHSFMLEKRDTYPIINIIEGQITTVKTELSADKVEELLRSGELAKIAVIERHKATGHIGIGLIAGYGIRNGAIASTVAHDSHNLIVVGTSENDMLMAAKELLRVQGGYTMVSNGKVLGTLELPICGLMSELTAEDFILKLDEMITLAHSIKITKGIDPFITLSFMALPVIPDIRITDMGVFDVIKGEFI